MKINYWKNRLLVAFLLTFASLADMARLAVGDGFLGIIRIFLILGVAFIIQDTFRWARIVLIIITSTYYMLWFTRAIIDNKTRLEHEVIDTIFVPAATPLYVSLFLIGILSYLFLRNYDLSK